MPPLILSVFPGIGMLDMAFEEEGFAIVRGPDRLWGGDIRRFHVPGGVFAGVIGGPPCQAFSRLAFFQRAQGREPRYGNLIPEFCRVVGEAQPDWFLMENVPGAPLPEVDGYQVYAQLLNNRWMPQESGIGAEQRRERRICFGTPDGRPLHVEMAALESPLLFGILAGHSPTPGQRAKQRPTVPQAVVADTRAVPVKLGGSGKVKATSPCAVTSRHEGRLPWAPGAVTSSDGGQAVCMTRYRLPEACRLQGLPEDFLKDAPFTAEGKLRVVANGVPLPMGRALAKAVKRAMGYEEAAA